MQQVATPVMQGNLPHSFLHNEAHFRFEPELVSGWEAKVIAELAVLDAAKKNEINRIKEMAKDYNYITRKAMQFDDLEQQHLDYLQRHHPHLQTNPRLQAMIAASPQAQAMIGNQVGGWFDE